MALSWDETKSENAIYDQNQHLMRITKALWEWIIDDAHSPDIDAAVTVTDDDAQVEDSSAVNVPDDYDYLRLQPGDWDLKAVMIRLRETGGSFGVDWELVKTNEDNPGDPASNASAWQTVDSGSIGGGGQVNNVYSLMAEDVALGIKASSSGNNGSAIRRISGTDSVEMTELINSLEARVGDTSDAAAGNDSSGSLIAQMRETAKMSGSLYSEALDRLRSSLFLNDGSGNIVEVEADPQELALKVVEQLRPAYEDASRAKAYTEINTRRSDQTLAYSTSDTNWSNVASLNVHTIASLQDDEINFWRAARPYVKVTSANGFDTDARLLQAIDPRHAASDAPNGALSNGDGWIIVDEKTALANGNDWPENGQFYYRDTHLFVLQVRQNTSSTGSEDVDAILEADREV